MMVIILVGGIIHNCESLSTITISPENKNVVMIDGAMYTYDKKILLMYPSADTRQLFCIPEGVEIISSNACSCNHYVTEIIMPNSVKKLDTGHFMVITIYQN